VAAKEQFEECISHLKEKQKEKERQREEEKVDFINTSIYIVYFINYLNFHCAPFIWYLGASSWKLKFPLGES
jgi:hypothetical protein